MVPFSSCMSLLVFCILFFFQLLRLLKSSTNEVYFSFSVYQFFKNFIKCINIQGCYVLFINWPLSHQGMEVFIFTNISCFRIYFVSDFLQIGISFCISYFIFILTHLCYYIYSKYFKYLVVFFSHIWQALPFSWNRQTTYIQCVSLIWLGSNLFPSCPTQSVFTFYFCTLFWVIFKTILLTYINWTK